MKKTFLVIPLLGLTLLSAGCSSQTSPTPTTPGPSSNGSATITPPASTTGFKTGEEVLVNWHQGDAWRQAMVTGVQGDQVTITYTSDRSTGTLLILNVAHLPGKVASVKVGDKVVAKWTDKNFYNGTVLEVSKDTAKIQWASGDSTQVSLKDITIPGV